MEQGVRDAELGGGLVVADVSLMEENGGVCAASCSASGTLRVSPHDFGGLPTPKGYEDLVW